MTGDPSRYIIPVTRGKAREDRVVLPRDAFLPVVDGASKVINSHFERRTKNNN